MAPPNKVVIVSGIRGQRMLIGKCGLALFCLEKATSLSLEIMTITVLSREAETVKGVKINLKSFAQVKVKSKLPNGSLDKASIKLAATNFMSMREREIEEVEEGE